LPSERADLLARLHRDGTVRDLHYEEGFTRVIGTVPTRALEVFAPFLAEPLTNAEEKALPASTE
jgi:hypothetical protein